MLWFWIYLSKKLEEEECGMYYYFKEKELDFIDLLFLLNILDIKLKFFSFLIYK